MSFNRPFHFLKERRTWNANGSDSLKISHNHTPETEEGGGGGGETTEKGKEGILMCFQGAVNRKEIEMKYAVKGSLAIVTLPSEENSE